MEKKSCVFSIGMGVLKNAATKHASLLRVKSDPSDVLELAFKGEEADPSYHKVIVSCSGHV
jgi:hypothetical protein